jgi:hypothetical protein
MPDNIVSHELFRFFLLLWQQGIEKADQMGFVCFLTEYLLEAKVSEQVDVFFFHWCRVTLAASLPHSGLFSPCFQSKHEKKEYTRFTAYARGKYRKKIQGGIQGGKEFLHWGIRRL